MNAERELCYVLAMSCYPSYVTSYVSYVVLDSLNIATVLKDCCSCPISVSVVAVVQAYTANICLHTQINQTDREYFLILYHNWFITVLHVGGVHSQCITHL